MSIFKVASRYAQSLLDLAIENDQLEEVYKDVVLVEGIIKSHREIAVLLKSPVIKEDKKRKILDQIFSERIGDLTMSFMRIITNKKREPHLSAILKAFRDMYFTEKGITQVRLITAIPADKEFESRVMEVLKAKFGLKKVELTKIVDEKLIGGFIVEFNNNRYDASLVQELMDLRQNFSKNYYQKTA